jgi:ribosomal protein L32
LSLVAVSEREESEGTDYAYRISFTVLDCQQCGGQRLATRSCPECGALPDDGETDPVLEQRRQAATLALDLLHAPLSEVSSELELGSLLDAAGTISPRFLSAFRDVAAGIETDELLIAVASL